MSLKKWLSPATRSTSAKRKTKKARKAAPAFGHHFQQLEDRLTPALVINPTFAANILADVNTVAIQGAINEVIAAYQNTFTNNVTVNITFQEGAGLGGSSTFLNTISYTNYHNAIIGNASGADDTTALASLPAGANQPIAGTASNTNMQAPTALIRTLGLAGGITPLDSTITLNTSIMNLTRGGVQNPAFYDIYAVTSHEIDEALGLGSGLDGSAQNAAITGLTVEPADLFRYSAAGVRSFNTTLATTAFFSIDGGTTNLAQFNQTAGGDFGDWFSTGPHVPQVQDAFGTPNAKPNLNVELRRADVIGYTRVAPVALTITPPALQVETPGVAKAFNLGTITNGNGPFTVVVNWNDATPNTTFYVDNIGSLGTQTHTYATGGNFTPTVTVTDFTNQTGSTPFNVTSGTVSVSLDIANNLVIQDTVGNANNLTLQSDTVNSKYIINDPVEVLFSAIPGAVSSNGGHTLTIPFAAVTGLSILVNTAAGSDSLTVDYSLGNITKTIIYDGGTGVTDSLFVTGGNFASGASTPSGPHSGTLTHVGGTTGTAGLINYSNLTPVTDTTVAAAFTINGTAAADTINIVDGIAGQTQVNSGGTFELVNFSNKTAVTVNALAGVDTITVNNPTPATGLTSLTVDSGDGNDIVNVLKTPTTVATNITSSVSSGGVVPTDTVTIGNAGSVQGILGVVNVSNPPALTNLIIDNSSNGTAGLNPTLAASSLTGLAPAVINWAQSDLNTLTISGGTAAHTWLVTGTPSNGFVSVLTTLNSGTGVDTVNVRATGGINGASLIVQGQSGADTVNIGSTAPAIFGTLAGIAGAVRVQNSGSLTALTIDDSGDATARPTAVLDQVAVGPQIFGRLTGLGTAAAITYAMAFTNDMSSVTINGGSGGNTIAVNQPTAAVSNFTTTLNSGTGADTVNVQATSKNESYVIQGQNGADAVNIGSLAPTVAGGTLAGIAGAVRVQNTGLFTALTIDDSGDATARPTAVLDQVLVGAQTFGRLTGLGNAAPITYAMAFSRDVSSVAINGGTGGNTIAVNQPTAATNGLFTTSLNSGSGTDIVNVQTTSANVTYNIFAGNGADTINLGNAGSTQGIVSTVVVIGQGATGETDTINVNDQADATARIVHVNNQLVGAGALGAGVGSGGIFGPGGILNYDNSTEAVNINVGTGDNTINVDSTLSLPTFPIVTTINGNTGKDGFFINGAGLGANSTNNFNGGSGDDTFTFTTLATSATTTVNVDGGSPVLPTQPGDTLNIDALGAGVTFAPGSITVFGTQPVNYVSIETLNLANPGPIVVNGDATANTLILTSVNANSATFQLDGGPVVAFSGSPSFTFNGLAGADTMEVLNPLFAPTIVPRAGTTPVAPLATAIYAPVGGVFFNGGTESDQLLLNGNLGAAGSGTYTTGATTATGFSGTITHTAGANTQTINFTGLQPVEDLTVMGTFTINDLVAGGTTNVIAGPISIQNDALTGVPALTYEVNFAGAAELYRFRNKTNVIINGDAGGNTINVNVPTHLDALATLLVNSGTGVDTVNVLATPAAVLTTIQGQNGDDNVNIGSLAPTVTGGNLNAINGVVEVDNTLGKSQVTIDASGDATAHPAALIDSELLGGNTFGRVTGLGNPAEIRYRTNTRQVRNVIVNSGSGGDNITINQTLAAESPYLTTVSSGGGNDTFVVTGIALNNNYQLNGQSGNDTFKIVTAPVAGVSLNINGSAGGQTDTDTLIGPDINNTWSITGANAGKIVNVVTSFTSIENLSGGSASDNFVFNPTGSISGTIDGKGTNDILDFSALPSQSVALRGVGTVDGFNGSVAADQFGITNGAIAIPTVTGFLNINTIISSTVGAADALYGTGLAANWVLTGTGAGTYTDIASGKVLTFSKFEILGGSGGDTLTGPNTVNTWNITGANAGNVVGTAFTGMANLNGGSLADTFIFAAGGSLTGVLDGQGLADSINFAALGSQAIVLTAVGGTDGYNGTAGPAIGGGFKNINAITGSLAGLTDSLTGLNTNSIWTVTAGSSTYQDIGSGRVFTFSNFETLNGGAGNDQFTIGVPVPTVTVNGGVGIDTLTGPNVANFWTITAAGGGKVGTVTFAAFENLVGGSMADTFQFGAAGSVAGTVNGGAGENWLDYSLVGTAVGVNFATGIASLIGGGVSNVRNALGSAVGGDTLTAGAAGGVLVGHVGNNTLRGSGGASILISGAGVNKIFTGIGGDLAIAGSTAWDANTAVLASMLAEWQSGNSYQTRINNLKNGGGLNGANTLVQGVTVFSPAAPPAIGPKFGYGGNTNATTITVAAGGLLNWYFTNYAQAIVVKKANEQIN